MSDKPTVGPWAVEADASGPKIRGADGVFVTRIAWMPGQEQANAHLIAEAGTVHHETGLTPRQLVEQRDALAAAVEAMHKAFHPITCGNSESQSDALESAREALAMVKGAKP